MNYKNASEALSAFVHAYYDERNIEATLSCVTEDIAWVGIENDDNLHGKAALRTLLEAEKASFPFPFAVDMEPPIAREVGKDVVIFTVIGKETPVHGFAHGFFLRGTGCCVRTPKGWLMNNIHFSVANGEIENSDLKKELNEIHQKEKALMASIPGGVAIYRLKKDGRVVSDYTSESLAKLCGYEIAEYTEYIKDDAMVNIAPEDIPRLRAAIAVSLEAGMPIHCRYRIFTKGKELILNQLDANVIPDAKLREDDIAVAYAVHSLISDADKKIQSEQIRYRAILDMLGIAFVEHTEEEGFYTSEKFNDYVISDSDIGILAANPWELTCVHPEDVPILSAFFQSTKDHAQGILRPCG